MKRLVSGMTALFLLLLVAAPTVAQLPKEPKYRGKTAQYWLARLTSDQQTDRQMALAGLLVLGEKAKVAAVPILADMLEDRHIEFRLFAAHALGKLGPTAKGAVPALIVALRDNQDKDNQDKVRQEVIWALGDIGPEAAEAVPTLMVLFGQDKLDTYLISTFAKIGPAASAALPTLKQAYDHIDPKASTYFYRRPTLEAMGQLGPKAAAVLMDIFEKSNDEYDGVLVAVALAKMGPSAVEIVPRLAKALPSKGRRCRAEGAYALWRLGQHPLALPILIRALEEHLEKPLQSESPFHSGYPGSAEALCSHLAKIGPVAKGAIPALTKLLTHPEQEMRISGAWALWHIAKHPQSIPTLEKCLYFTIGNGTYVNWRVVERIGEIGPEAKAALPALEAALKMVTTTYSTLEYGRDWQAGHCAGITEAMRQIAPEKFRKAP